MKRYDTIFQIGYSIRVEKMQATLLARIDRFMNFSQILLGAADISSWSPVAIGIAVAIIAAASFVYQPGVKSMAALIQKQKYEQLQANESDLSDNELRKQYAALQAGDSQIIGALANPAHMGEEIRLGHKPDFELTTWEKLVAWAAGDLPSCPKQDGDTSESKV